MTDKKKITALDLVKSVVEESPTDFKNHFEELIKAKQIKVLESNRMRIASSMMKKDK